MKKTLAVILAVVALLGALQTCVFALDGEEITLSKVNGLAAQNVTSTAFSLRWDPVDGADSYKVYEKFGESFNCIATTPNTTVALKSKKPGTTYCYYVDAVRAGVAVKDTSSDPLTVRTLPQDGKLKKVSFKKNTATVTWRAGTGATGYTVYSYNASAKAYKQLKSVDKTSYTFKYKAGKKYTLLIRSFCKLDGTTVYSAKGVKVVFTAPKALPTSKKAAAKLYNSAVNNLKENRGKFKIENSTQINHKIKKFKGGEDAEFLLDLWSKTFDLFSEEFTSNYTVKNGKVYVEDYRVGKLNKVITPANKKAALSSKYIDKYSASVLSNGNVKLKITLKKDQTTLNGKKEKLAPGISKVYDPVSFKNFNLKDTVRFDSGTITYSKSTLTVIVRPDGKPVSIKINLPWTVSAKFTVFGEYINAVNDTKNAKDDKASFKASGKSYTGYDIYY